MNSYQPVVPRPRPPSFPLAVFRVAWIAPLSVLRGKRLLALLLLVGTPLLAVLLMRIYGTSRGLGVRGFIDVLTILYLPVIFPVALLFLVAGSIGDDIDNGTLTYLRLRPLGRGAIVCGRYLAACLSAVVLLAPSMTLLYLLQVGWGGRAALVEQLPVLAVLYGIIVLAALAYGALFLLFSLLLRHAVIVGLFFAVGWEVLASKIPSKAALLTVSFYVHSILWRAAPEGRALRKFMGLFEELEIVPTAGGAVLGLLAASGVLLAIACQVFSHKEYIERPGDA